MAQETFLQHWLFAKFILPFFLMFFLVFAILQKTKVLGENKTQLDALVAFVIGLIFVGVAYPRDVVGNMIVFFTIALVIIFVGMVLWGFLGGGEAKLEGKGVKIAAGVVLIIAVILAVLWATGINFVIFENFFNLMFDSDWSNSFWTNVIFLVLIAAAMAAVLLSARAKS